MANETAWEWYRTARNKGDIEHIVCFDFGRFFVSQSGWTQSTRIVWNYGLWCSVDATNMAAATALGDVLVVISDDIKPCDRWDEELDKISQLHKLTEPTVVRVATGGPADKRGLMAIQILNRARFEQLGYLFHPSYLSMFADDEYSQHAEDDGIVVTANWIRFPHYHWSHKGELSAPKDPVYEAQNRQGRYTWGEANFARRQEHGWPISTPLAVMESRARVYFNETKTHT